MPTLRLELLVNSPLWPSTSENSVVKTKVKIDVSEIPHMSKKENVERFNNMRKEC